MRQSSRGLQPLSRYSASWPWLSIGPPPDWGMDIGASPALPRKLGRQKWPQSAGVSMQPVLWFVPDHDRMGGAGVDLCAELTGAQARQRGERIEQGLGPIGGDRD